MKSNRDSSRSCLSPDTPSFTRNTRTTPKRREGLCVDLLGRAAGGALVLGRRLLAHTAAPAGHLASRLRGSTYGCSRGPRMEAAAEEEGLWVDSEFPTRVVVFGGGRQSRRGARGNTAQNGPPRSRAGRCWLVAVGWLVAAS
jgi:hypothetical protein